MLVKQIFISSEKLEETEIFRNDMPILISEEINFLSSTRVFPPISLHLRIMYIRKLTFVFRT